MRMNRALLLRISVSPDVHAELQRQRVVLDTVGPDQGAGLTGFRALGRMRESVPSCELFCEPKTLSVSILHVRKDLTSLSTWPYTPNLQQNQWRAQLWGA